jgi:hypothetical protein
MSLVVDDTLPSSSSICSLELSTGSMPNGSIALADIGGISVGDFMKIDPLTNVLRSSLKTVTRKLCFDSCSSSRLALRACLTACDLAERLAPRSCFLQGPLSEMNLNSLAATV